MAVLSVRLRVGALVVGLLSVVAGCAGPEQPTYSCTPETGGAPFPCYKAQWDLYQKQDRLYTEAETVYRKFLAEDERIWRAGGASTLTPVILETTSGGFQRALREEYVALKRSETRMQGGPLRIAWFKRNPKALQAGSAVTLDVCVDGRAAVLRDPTQKWSAGYTFDTVQFTRDQGTIKISGADGYEPKSC